jgi:hypothetical protein
MRARLVRQSICNNSWRYTEYMQTDSAADDSQGSPWIISWHIHIHIRRFSRARIIISADIIHEKKFCIHIHIREIHGCHGYIHEYIRALEISWRVLAIFALG